MTDVLDGTINPGVVSTTRPTSTTHPRRNAAMDERQAIKSLIRVERTMSTWTPGQSHRVGSATELDLASKWADGSMSGYDDVGGAGGR